MIESPLKIIQGYSNDPIILSYVPEILELYKDSFGTPNNITLDFNYICNSADSNPYWILVCWYNKPISMTCLRKIEKVGKHYWFMFNFCVRKLRRREGWGTILYKEVKKFCSLDYFIWLVDENNYEARLFYTKMGALYVMKENEHIIHNRGLLMYSAN